jgi:hypothetical protein
MRPATPRTSRARLAPGEGVVVEVGSDGLPLSLPFARFGGKERR